MSFKNERFTCFACGAHGDVIDLVGKLINSTAMDTVKELNSSYHLGIDVTIPVDRKLALQALKARKEKESFAKWEKDACNTYCQYFRLLRDWKQDYAPKHPDEAQHPFFVEACNKLDYIEYLCDTVFICGLPDDKKRFFFSHHRETEQLRKRLDNIENNQNYMRGMVA